MRCPSCGTENREGRKFCSNCGATLAVVCPVCGSANEPDERFCGECGARLDAPAKAAAPEAAVAPEPAHPEEERRVVTVLFADLAGFTSMSEGMDPEAVKSLAAHCAGLMSEEVSRFGGTVSSVMGDAIMAMFGAPVSHEDDPERAVRAAVAMRESIAAVEGAPKRLELHVGINTGETMAGLIGPDEARDYTAMGDTTNTAARLMGAAPAGSIYIGKLTHDAIERTVVCRPAEPVKAKGKAEPVPVWEVVEVPSLPAARPLGTGPLVGRDAELGQLRELWTDVCLGGHAAMALLLGPPGIGKSRLLEEFYGGMDGAVLRGRCLPYGDGITYWPIVEMVKESAGIMHDDDHTTTTAKLGALIEGLRTQDQDELRTIATALATLVGAPSTPRGTYRATAITQGELHWGIRRVFEHTAEARPLVLTFEDLHWAEPTLLELVDDMALHAAGPILVLGTSRPELTDTWTPSADGHRSRLIPLRALTPEESESLIATLVPSHALGSRSIDVVLRSAAGNPLFLEETVGMLSDAGVLEGQDVDLDESAVPVPGSIQGLIESRLDLLPSEDRRMTQLASVVGLVFWLGLLTHLRDGAAGVMDALGRLELRDLVHKLPTSSIADELEFAFKHALIRDVAYGRLPKRLRSELHARCAGWVSRLPGAEDDLIEIVAYHLESACTLSRELGPGGPEAPLWPAAAALERAGEKAERREGTTEADRFYARALDLVGDEPDEAVTHLRLHRSRTLTALGQLQDAVSLLERVAEEAVPLQRSDLRGYALVGLANVLQKLGRASEARGHLTEAAGIASEVQDARLRVRTAYESAELRADFEAEVDAAVDDLLMGVTTAEEMDDLALRIEGHLRTGTILATAGRLKEAEKHLERCAELAEQTGSHRDDARAAYLLAYVKYYLGERAEADRLARRAAELLELTADRYFQIQNMLVLGRFALTRGDLDEAAEWVRQAVPLARVLGGWLLVEATRYLVEILVLQGRQEEAHEVTSAAAEAVPEEDAFAQAASLLSRGMVETKDDERALTRMRAALAMLETQSVPIELAEARLSCARVLALRRRRSEAGALLEEVRASVEGTEAQTLVTVADEMAAGMGEGAG
jgi:class 3 adenylate cyclase/tetratricopeptide (TPR) repeat protein